MDSARLPLLKVAVLTFCSVLQMGLQFLMLTLIAWWFGTSLQVDSFNAAIAIPIALSAVMAAPLPLVLVPEMVRLESSGEAGQAWRLASALLAGFAILGVALAVTLSSLPVDSIAWIFGFDENGLVLTAVFLGRLSWLIPLNGSITLLQGIHHAGGRFTLPALSNVIGVSVPLLWIAALSSPSLLDVADGTVAGAAVAVAILLLPVRKSLLDGWRGSSVRTTGLLRFLVLLAPLLFAGMYSRIDPVVDRVIASHGDLPTGSIAELGYAQRLAFALAALVSSGLSVIIFPQFAAAAGDSLPHRLTQLLALSFRFLVFLLVPCVVAILCYAPAIIAELFERGAFDAEATRMVALLLRILLAVLVAGSVGEIIAKALYACGNTRGPALVAVGGFTLGVALKFILAGPLGIAGVAAGTAVYYLVNLTLLLLMTQLRFGGKAFTGVSRAFVHCTFASLVAAAVGGIPLLLIERGGAILGGLVGLVVYLLCQSALGNEFVPRQVFARPTRDAPEPR